MNERIRELRESLGLNQTDFGARIGVKQTTIAGYENGTRTPQDAVLLNICREFGVDEIWLRTGVGEMFRKKERGEEIADFLGTVLSAEAEDFRRRLVLVMSRLGVEEWEVLERIARLLVDEFQENKKNAGPT